MCDVCLGMSGCPVCTPEPDHEACEACDGTGHRYFYDHPETGEIIEVDQETYKNLPKEDCTDDFCENCLGDGEFKTYPE